MRLLRMNVAGFRGFADPVEFNLDADVVLVSGPNGTGKTSFFDAILWGLTGAVERIGSNSDLVNRFGDFGDARVELVLQENDGRELTVVRRFSSGTQPATDAAERTGRGGSASVGSSNGKETLTVAYGDSPSKSGTAAQSLLSSKLCRGSDDSDGSSGSLSRSLTRSVYLEQDRVNAFVQTDDPKERFEVISELMGAAVLGELNRQLDSSRRAWTKKTNDYKHKIDAMRQQRGNLQDRLDNINSNIDTGELRRQCHGWLQKANEVSAIDRLREANADSDLEALGTSTRLLIRSRLEETDLADWASSIDATIRRIAHEERIFETDLSRCTQLRNTLSRLPDATDDPDEVSDIVQGLELRAAEASQELERAEAAVSAARRRQLAQAEASESLRNMAQFALRHLDELCPVCEQEYDRRKTQKRLHSLIEQTDPSLDTPEGDSLDVPETKRLLQAADDLQHLEAQLASEKARLRRAVSDSRRSQELEAEIKSLTQRSTGTSQPAAPKSQQAKRAPEPETADEPPHHTPDVATPDDPASPAAALDYLESTISEHMKDLESLRRSGEKLAVSVARATEAAESEALHIQIVDLDTRIGELETKCVSRDLTSDNAKRLHNAVRLLGESLVEHESSEIEPLLQRIYETVDPHPEFSAVRLLIDMKRGRGHLWTGVEADRHDGVIRVEEPKTVLSSSQLNVLAVAVFLALNLSQENLPVGLMILDDPLQSLDNVNLLGLADLLRKLRGRRQMMISTHNELLASLFARKLRPVKQGQATRIVSLTAWDREGPTIEQSEVPNSPMEMHMAGTRHR